MTDLLSAPELAAAVSAITDRCCGLTFVPGQPLERGESVGSRLFIFPFHGRRRFSLLLTCDQPTSVALAARLAGNDEDVGAGEVIEASIRDLLSRVAMGLETALDRSRAASAEPGPAPASPLTSQTSEGIPLRSDDAPGVRLWVVHRAAMMSTPAFVSELARDFQ